MRSMVWKPLSSFPKRQPPLLRYEGKGTVFRVRCPSRSQGGPSVSARRTAAYRFGLLLQVNDLRQQVRDLLLLAGSVFGLLGQFLRDAGDLHVGVPFDQETTIARWSQTTTTGTPRENGFFAVGTRESTSMRRWGWGGGDGEPRGHRKRGPGVPVVLDGEAKQSGSPGSFCREEGPGSQLWLPGSR